VGLTVGPLVGRSGEVAAGTMLRWPKNSKEKVEPLACLVGGELKSLPALKDLASARLVFPVARAHTKAPTKVGVVALRAAPTRGRGDLDKLGDVLGDVIVPRFGADGPPWMPAREFKVDVTRHLRSVILGDVRFHGFALRVVPDRGVDDGWTVAIGLPKEAKVYLEVDVYTGRR
jgi:hypothetical protein